MSASAWAVGDSILFAGAWFDAEAGLYLFGARWYDPATGRFLTREPVDAWANAEDFGNAYVYAANNPASYGDATGYKARKNVEQFLDNAFGGRGNLLMMGPSGAIVKAFFDPRVQGLFRAVGGGFRAVGGFFMFVAGMAAEGTVVGVPAGVAMMALGAAMMGHGAVDVVFGFMEMSENQFIEDQLDAPTFITLWDLGGAALDLTAIAMSIKYANASGEAAASSGRKAANTFAASRGRAKMLNRIPAMRAAAEKGAKEKINPLTKSEFASIVAFITDIVDAIEWTKKGASWHSENRERKIREWSSPAGQ